MKKEDIDKSLNVISTITTIDQFIKRWNIEEHNGIQLLLVLNVLVVNADQI
ncbi:hypothetical protein ACNSOP_07075 [Aliarcobacter lanthieri]|uniref:hypothetical protein n=1 Tax=Aliarcobacter lanthieri TaxID=1355374 RepID=UPI003AA7F0FB